jgi:hypothetical protein
MSALLSIVLAGAAVVPAAPIAANTWFTSKDNPKTAMEVARRGHVAYRIDVAPDGTAIRCETPETEQLDHKVCELVMKRARFRPATDERGQPAFAVHDGVSSFLMPGGPPRPDRARLTVAVESLPAGVTGPAYARVAFAVDAAGAVSQCAAMASEPRRRFMQNVEALVPAACAAVAKDYRATPARNAAGEAVASVQNLTVRFDARPAP